MRSRAVLALLPLLVALVAQTTEVLDAGKISAEISKIMMPIVAIVVLITLPLLIFKTLKDAVLDVVRR